MPSEVSSTRASTLGSAAAGAPAVALVAGASPAGAVLGAAAAVAAAGVVVLAVGSSAMAAGASTRLSVSAAMARQARDWVGEAEGLVRVMLAGPDEEKRRTFSKASRRAENNLVAIIASNSC